MDDIVIHHQHTLDESKMIKEKERSEKIFIQMKNDKEWFLRIEEEAHEAIRLLTDQDRAKWAIKKLHECPFNDLPNFEQITLDLISAIDKSGNGIDLLRKATYTLVRRNIYNVRNESIQKIIEELESIVDSNQDDYPYVAELDTCTAILKLIPENQSILDQIKAELHFDVIHKKSVRMISLILQGYAALGISFKNKWFSTIIKIEDMYAHVMSKHEGLSHLKRYIYSEYSSDWRVMCISFQRMEEIITKNTSEDIQNSAFWTGMSGGDSVKIFQFANPSPIYIPYKGYVPFLCDKSRYFAAQFLIACSHHQDSEIAEQAIKSIQAYKKIEKNAKILRLYESFQDKTQPIDTKNEILDDKLTLFTKSLSFLSSQAISLKTLEQMVRFEGIEFDIQKMFDIKNEKCTLKPHLKKELQDSIESEDILFLRKRLLVSLGKSFHFQPRKVTTWRDSRVLVFHIEHLLKDFYNDLEDDIIDIISKLKEYYEVVKDDKDKLRQYETLYENCEIKLKVKQLYVWHPKDKPYTLFTKDYGSYFEEWKKAHGLSKMVLQSFKYKNNGELFCEFEITPHEGEVFSFQLTEKNKKIKFDIPEHLIKQFEKNVKLVETFSTKNTPMKVFDTMDRIVQRKSIEGGDAFIFNDFFENLLIGQKPNFENIVISCAYYMSFFGFVLNDDNWGLPTIKELNEILDSKICLSYVHHVLGREYAEETYLEHNKTAINHQALALIPRCINFTADEEINKKIIFLYNSILESYEKLQDLDIMYSLSSIIKYLSDSNVCDVKTISYEVFLAFQKIALNHCKSWNFSVNRASIYLTHISKYLHSLQINNLKSLINLILFNTDMHFGKNKIENEILLLKNYTKIMHQIYTDKTRVESEISYLQDIFSNIKEITENIYTKEKKLKLNEIRLICNIYVWSKYIDYEWKDVEKILNKEFIFDSFSDKYDLILSIRTFMEMSVRFYILHNNHSEILLNLTSDLLKESLLYFQGDYSALLMFEKFLIPVSPILWATKISDVLLHFFEVLEKKLLNKTVEHASLKNLIRMINISIKMKENLKISKQDERTTLIYGTLEKLSNLYLTKLIRTYIHPLWMQAKHEFSSQKVRIILDSLNMLVKENESFLDLLEKEYQKFIFMDQKNEHTLESICEEFYNRFSNKPIYYKLYPRQMITYRSDGTIFETRRGFDVLGYIINCKKLLFYLRLEDGDSDFLSELITPTFINGSCRLTGFGGGGKMKKKVSRHGVPNNAILPLINENELTTGKFGKILECIPFIEGYYYWQRMFNPISQDGDLVSGSFRTLFLNDQTVVYNGITNADGTGFIKASVLGIYAKKLADRTPYSLKKPIQTHQAIHHNKRSLNKEIFDEAVIEASNNAQKALKEYIASAQADLSSVKELFSFITTGGINAGRNFVAIPACGENNITIPLSLKNSDICLGKTPHEKPTDVLLKQEHEISHLKSEDEEKRKKAEFLNSITGFQYSFIGANKKDIIFTKGILIVIDDDLWQHPDIDIVFCCKDVKVNSSWKEKKSQPLHDSFYTLNGVLTPTQQFGPGSFIATSKDIQISRWNADFDGDVITVEMKPKNTKMFTLLQKTMDQALLYNTPKIPKTFTPAYADGQFQMFRFKSIVQARTANLLTDYSKIYDIFTALKTVYQEAVTSIIVNMDIAESIIKNILVDETLINIRYMLKNEPSIVIHKILSAGIKTGSDCFKSRVDWTYFKKFANIVYEILDKMGIPTELVYFKKLCIEMHKNPINFEDVILEAQYQSRFFDSFPLHILYKTLSNIPKYRLNRLSQLLVKQIERDEEIRSSILQSKKNKKSREKHKVLQDKLTQISKDFIQDNLKNNILKNEELKEKIEKEEAPIIKTKKDEVDTPSHTKKEEVKNLKPMEYIDLPIFKSKSIPKDEYKKLNTLNKNFINSIFSQLNNTPKLQEYYFKFFPPLTKSSETIDESSLQENTDENVSLMKNSSDNHAHASVDQATKENTLGNLSEDKVLASTYSSENITKQIEKNDESTSTYNYNYNYSYNFTLNDVDFLNKKILMDNLAYFQNKNKIYTKSLFSEFYKPKEESFNLENKQKETKHLEVEHSNPTILEHINLYANFVSKKNMVNKRLARAYKLILRQFK